MNPNKERWAQIAEQLPKEVDEGEEGFLTRFIVYEAPDPIALAYSVIRYPETNIVIKTNVTKRSLKNSAYSSLLHNALAFQFSDGLERIAFNLEDKTFRASNDRKEAWADIFRYPKLVEFEVDAPEAYLEVESWTLEDMDEYILSTTKHDK